MFATILKGGVGSGRHKGIPSSKLYKLVHAESGKIIAEGNSKHMTSLNKAKNKEHGKGTHFVGMGSPNSTVGTYWSNTHDENGVKRPADYWEKKEETMSILDSVNERFNAQKEYRELQLLSPLELLSKSIQDDVVTSNTCLVQKDWAAWRAKHTGNNKPHALGTKVRTEDGQEGEVSHVVTSNDPEYPHKYRLSDSSGKRMFNNQYQNHNNLTVCKKEELVQKGGPGSGPRKGNSRPSMYPQGFGAERDPDKDDGFDNMHPLDYYDQGGFQKEHPKTSGTHHTKQVSTGDVMVHGTQSEMEAHVNRLNAAYGDGKYVVGENSVKKKELVLKDWAKWNAKHKAAWAATDAAKNANSDKYTMTKLHNEAIKLHEDAAEGLPHDSNAYKEHTTEANHHVHRLLALHGVKKQEDLDLIYKDWKDWNDKHKQLAQGHESALKYHDHGSFEFKGQAAGDLHKTAANLHRTALAAHQKALIEPSEENSKKAMCATGDSKDATYAAIKSTPAYQPKGAVKKADLELIYKDWAKWNEAKRGMTPTGEHTGAHLRPASNPKPGMAFRFAGTPNKHFYGGESTRLDNHQFDHKTYNKNPNPSAHHAPNAPQVAIDATKERAESHIDEANKNRHSYPGEKDLVHSKPQAPKKQGRFAHFMDSLARMGSSG